MKPKANFAKLLTALLLAAILITTLPAAALAAAEPDPANNPPPLTQPNPDYPKAIPIERNIVQISTNSNHNLAIDDLGVVYAWGGNNAGQIGNGKKVTTVPSSTNLTSVKLPGKAVKVLAIADASVALLENGSVYIWGNHTISVKDKTVPTLLAGVSDVVDIAGKNGSVFVQCADGTMYGWGRNPNGELGLGHASSVNQVTEIPALANRAMPQRFIYFSMFIEEDELWAWGENRGNILQLHTAEDARQTTPAPTTLSGITAVASGSYNILALDEEGRLLAWGDNASGELGLGRKDPVDTPTIVPIDGEIAEITMMFGASALLKKDGTVWVTGHSDYLGLNTEKTEFTQLDLPEIVHLEVGATHMFAQTASGDWWGWGLNSTSQVTPTVPKPYPTDYNIYTPILIFTADGTTGPVDPDPDPDTHNVTIIVKYTDGAHPDEVTTYAVPEGAEFFEDYTVQPGYKYRGVSLYSFFYNVDSFDQTVYISEVYQDITVELNYDPVPTHNVTVTIRYEDGALPDAVETYAVPAGEAFSTAYEMLEGYTLRNVEANALGVAVDGVDQTINIRAVNGAIDILIILAQE